MFSHVIGSSIDLHCSQRIILLALLTRESLNVMRRTHLCIHIHMYIFMHICMHVTNVKNKNSMRLVKRWWKKPRCSEFHNIPNDTISFANIQLWTHYWGQYWHRNILHWLGLFEIWLDYFSLDNNKFDLAFRLNYSSQKTFKNLLIYFGSKEKGSKFLSVSLNWKCICYTQSFFILTFWYKMATP